MRRLATDGGYDLVGRVAPILHGAMLTTENGNRIDLPTLPVVTAIEVLTDAALDQANPWAAGVRVQVELRLPIPDDCEGPLDDWLRVGASFDIPHGKPAPAVERIGEGDADLDSRFDLPQ